VWWIVEGKGGKYGELGDRFVIRAGLRLVRVPDAVRMQLMHGAVMVVSRPIKGGKTGMRLRAESQ
jgi:hypothetical protein